MQLDVSSGIRRTRRLSVITDGNDVVKMSSLKFGNVLRAVTRNIDPYFPHHFNGSRVHPDRIGPCALNFEPTSG